MPKYQSAVHDPGSSPSLEGVQHRLIDIGNGISIHVAEAGPVDGPPVLLVHGFPQNWWEWRDIIGPLAADGYRVLCPDLRGAGWCSAPPDRYQKIAMADDLAAVIDHFGIGSMTVVAHDWGGPASFIMMLRHPQKVAGYFGVNTLAPRLRRDRAMFAHSWRCWYQLPIALPQWGPRLIADRKARFVRLLVSWVGGGFSIPEHDFWLYVDRMRESGHAVAGSRWYRTFLVREFIAWLRGEFADARVRVPVRWLHGTADPVITPTLLRDYNTWIDDYAVELVYGVGHWFAEQHPDILLDRLRPFLGSTSASDRRSDGRLTQRSNE